MHFYPSPLFFFTFWLSGYYFPNFASLLLRFSTYSILLLAIAIWAIWDFRLPYWSLPITYFATKKRDRKIKKKININISNQNISQQQSNVIYTFKIAIISHCWSCTVSRGLSFIECCFRAWQLHAGLENRVWLAVPHKSILKHSQDVKLKLQQARIRSLQNIFFSQSQSFLLCISIQISLICVAVNHIYRCLGTLDATMTGIENPLFFQHKSTEVYACQFET